MVAPSGGQAGGQTRVRGVLATSGGETLLLLGLLPGSWSGGLDRWFPYWVLNWEGGLVPDSLVSICLTPLAE